VLARSGKHLGVDNVPPAGFSRREVEILYLIAGDFSDKEIALTLGMSPHTLRTHLSRLYRKHGVHSRAAAVATWLGFAPRLPAV
jgi:DNA-binding CsgD family transcriptional regulator